MYSIFTFMYTKIRIYIPHLRDTDRRRSHQPGICILYLRVCILHIRSVCYIHTRHGPPMVTSARYIVYYIYVYKYRYSRAHYTRVKVTFSTCPSWGFCAARPSHTKYVSSTMYADPHTLWRTLWRTVQVHRLWCPWWHEPGIWVRYTHTLTHTETHIYYEENFKYIKQTHPPTHPPTQIRMRSERRWEAS